MFGFSQTSPDRVLGRHGHLWFFALVLLTACDSAEPPVAKPRPVVVEVPRPLSGESEGLVLPGSIHARIEADLSFRIPGKLAERRVDMGARVSKGAILAVLDAADADANLAVARAALAAGEADLVLAVAEERRQRDLRARGFVGQSQLDQSITRTRLARARVRQAKAGLDLAQNQSRYTHLTSDINGVVMQIYAEPGSVVAAGQPVLRFAADGEREVHVTVPEGRLQALRAAERLEVELLSQPGQRYAGRVRDIDPQADRMTRTHLARITILDPAAPVQLGATASVVVLAKAGALSFRVPATALGATAANEPIVWRLVRKQDAEQVEPVPVQILQYQDGSVTLSGPLSATDRLVTAGVQQLVAGMQVEPIDRAAPAAL